MYSMRSNWSRFPKHFTSGYNMSFYNAGVYLSFISKKFWAPFLCPVTLSDANLKGPNVKYSFSLRNRKIPRTNLSESTSLYYYGNTHNNRIVEYDIPYIEIDDSMRYNIGPAHQIDTQEDRKLIMNNFSNDGVNVNGIPHQFINSFGNYIGLKYFLDGVSNKKNVYTYVDKVIGKDNFEKICSAFASYRSIYSNLTTEYEFYDEDFGYVVIRNDKGTPNEYHISCGIGYSPLNDLIKSMEEYKRPEPTASWVTGIDNHGELMIKELSIKEIHDYNPNFYPFMKGESIESFAARFIASKSSILILIGPPGTAKTNFIRQMLRATNESVLITYSDDLKKTDKLFSHFYDSQEKYLVIEDADTFIERREDGNSNMKQLLNITDGLTANPEKKVIFSVNLPNLNKADPALVRSGRCYAILRFSKLYGEDLEKAMDDIGMEHFVDIDGSNGFTIAELFAIKNGEQLDDIESSISFGFNSN